MRSAAFLFCLCVLSALASAGEPGVPYCNARRTGYADVDLEPPFRAAWVHRARHRPRPAWREPGWEPQRIDFDYAYGVSAAGDTVYYASSSDHALHALELRTGRERWKFRTDGPVRLAPEFHGANVLFGSDDGFVYCLGGEDGALVWKFRPATPDERLVGNEQMISRWPARSGVLVEGDRVYTTFGMLSPEGVSVCCLDAQTGSPVWVNDTCGIHFMTRPHITGMGGVSPQGYMALAGDVLVVTCARCTPALFDRDSGELLYHEAEGDFAGGAWTMTTGDLVFIPQESLRKEYGAELRRGHAGPEADVFELASLTVADARTGREVFTLKGGRRGILSDDGLITLQAPGRIVATRLEDVRNAIPQERTNISHYRGHYVYADKEHDWAAGTGTAYILLQARQTVFAGGRGAVSAVSASTGEILWQGDVDGQARWMCIAPGRLIVSTTDGCIHCFEPSDRPDGEPAAVTPRTQTLTVPPAAAEAVRTVLSESGVREGYCLVTGDASAGFLAELAHRSELSIYHVSSAPDSESVRDALDAAGLYGARVTVHHVPGHAIPYTDYFADLVVLDASDSGILARTSVAELYRLLRPYGGVATVLCADDLTGEVERRLAGGGVPEGEIQSMSGGVKIVRGALPGAGEWTHQYADPGKTAATQESRVRLPLKALWFGGLGPSTIVSRHFREPAPLVVGGRCFVPGTDHLTAMDIYNGRMLWQREFPDLAHWPAAYRGPGLAADHDALYALQGARCLRFDPATGDTTGKYEAPVDAIGAGEDAEGLIWEFLALVGDTVIGTLGAPNIKHEWWSKAYPVNRLLFALDRATGQPRWTWRPDEAVDSNAIAIEGGRIFVIDGRPRYGFLVEQMSRGGDAPPAPRKLKAFDVASGRFLWETADVVPTQNSLYAASGVVLAAINPISRGMEDRVVARQGQGLAAYDARDGSRLWRMEKIDSFTPVIMDGVLYTPRAYDLKSGRPVSARGSKTQLSVGMAKCCAALSGCPAFVMTRAGSMGFTDLRQQSGLYHYPILRASCWINMIPAGGLVVVPEGSSSCMCGYNYKTSIALTSDDRHFFYGLGRDYGRDGGTLRINFGAPGDRPDAEGHVWLCYPRPVAWGRPMGSSDYGPRIAGQAPVEAEGDETPGTWGRNPDWVGIAGTDRPWLYSCGITGPARLTLRLPGELNERDTCRVTLHFCELAEPPAPRVFAVRLQGEPVLSDFDVARAARGVRKALDRSFAVELDRTLTLELVPRGTDALPPILCGLSLLPE